VLVQRAAGWPIRECLVNEDWNEGANLARILIARDGPEGEIGCALFLVDLQCLGVKDCFCQPALSADDYADLREQIGSDESMEPCPSALAAAIVGAGLDYAADLGLRPHRGFRLAGLFLGSIDPTESPVPVVCGGKDGKPLYIPGPNDRPQRIIEQLQRRLGTGGFHLMAPVDLDAPPEPGDRD
jgi:hypothetical protein